MTLIRLVSRPVPRAGALLLLLAGLAALALGGLVGGQAALAPDDQLFFLRDAQLQRDAAAIDAATALSAEVEAIHKRGGTPRYVAMQVDQTEQYFRGLDDARDGQLRENARRWRRTQGLMGVWFGLAGLGCLATGVRQWRRAGAASPDAAT